MIHGVRRPLLVWLILLLLQWGLQARADGFVHEMTFQRILTDDNPTEYSIGGTNAIFQDKLGFIWIAGDHGLVRYDSTDFKFYFFDTEDDKTLSSNYLRGFIEDKSGNLWCIAYNGLNLYNPEADNFERFMHIENAADSLPGEEVNAAVVGKGNEIYIATEKGLSVLNAQRTSYTHFQHQSEDANSLSHNQVNSVFIDPQNTLWVGTKVGLDRFDADSGRFTHWQIPAELRGSAGSGSITKIAQDGEGFLWAANENNGVFRLSKDFSQVEHYRADPNTPEALQGNIVLAMLLDSQQRFWLAIDHQGIAQFNPTTKTFTHIRHQASNPQSLSSNQVRAIYEDNSKNFWAGTFPSGVNFYDHTKVNFRTLKHDPENPRSLNHNGMLNIFQDSEGIFWFGSEGGLNSLNPRTGKMARYVHQPNNPKSLRFNAVTAIREAPDGDLWIGAWSGGLHKFNKKTGEFRNYYPNKHDPRTMPSALVWNMVDDGLGGLWISFVEGGGLAHYSADSNNFTSYSHTDDDPNSISSHYINRIFSDSNHDLWLGTNIGLDKYDKITDSFVHYSVMAAGAPRKKLVGVNAIIENHAGELIIGTSDGFVKFMTKRGDIIKQFDVKSGAPYLEIANILEDEKHNLWISGSSGIIRLDTQTGAVRVFKKSHGLAGENSNRNAALKDHNGLLYFGSTEGITQFNPADLEGTLPPPNIAITDFRVFNKPVPISAAGNSPLKKSIMLTSGLVLDHTQNMFSFKFAALNFSAASGNRYAYRLEGFDKEWNFIGNNNSATYTNLDSGSYVFHVKAANSDGQWNEIGKQVVLKIAPPWWKSFWAYYAYIMLGLFFAAFVYRYQVVKFQEQKNREMNDELRKLHHVKDAFLANTSHELRTPVNGMVGIAEALAMETKNISRSQREKIQLIISSGKRLHNLINDILDYTKMADQEIVLYKGLINMHRLVNQVIQITSILTKNKQVRLLSSVASDAKFLYADPHRMEQILINLVSNAIKYSDKGEVKITAGTVDMNFVITVEDTGIGIAKADMEKLFKPFSQLESSAERRSGGTGLGLMVTRHLIERHQGTIHVTSEPGLGSCFIVSLPFQETSDYLANTPMEALLDADLTDEPAHQHVDDEPELTEIDQPDRLADRPRLNEGKLKILIADDDPINCMILTQLVKRMGYDIVSAYDGAMALDEMAANTQIVAAFLDLNMPKLNGFQVAEHMRQIPSLKDIPILFLSATITDADRAECAKIGLADIHLKPINKTTLQLTLDGLLAQVHGHKQLTPLSSARG